MAAFWTIQTGQAWEQAQALGELRGNPSWGQEGFQEPYTWMTHQMEKRLPTYRGGYPIWVWTEKPDLRQGGHLERGKIGVRLQLEVDPRMVLLSDFFAWHVVLNDGFLSLDERDHGLWAENMAPMSKEESWERIFDFDLLHTSEWWSDFSIVQGVVEKVSVTQVIGVTKFTAR
ncbi:MAG: DUF3841 domain-containing protein [Thermaerobacter sp.]|nr:DUF3841 domain-containing protein [Thermaerobacter sp.]